MNPFVNEICHYLADNTSGRFALAQGNSNLKVGELVRGEDGVFAVESTPNPPDRENPVHEIQVNFWAQNKQTSVAYEDLRIISFFFHQGREYITTNYKILRSFAITEIEDFDRDLDNRKILKLSITFIILNLIS